MKMRGILPATALAALAVLAAAPLAAGPLTITYRYDGAGRLVAADYGQEDDVNWTYDAAGNLLARTVGEPEEAEPVTLEFLVRILEKAATAHPPGVYPEDLDGDGMVTVLDALLGLRRLLLPAD